MLLPYCARYFCLPFYESPRHVKKWKKQLLVFIKYGRFWSIFLKLFSKLKLWNWEEWVLVSTYYMFFCSWSAKEVVHRWLRISYCVKKYVLYGLLLTFIFQTHAEACMQLYKIIILNHTASSYTWHRTLHKCSKCMLHKCVLKQQCQII